MVVHLTTGAPFLSAAVVAGYTDYTDGVLTLRVNDAVDQTGVTL